MTAQFLLAFFLVSFSGSLFHANAIGPKEPAKAVTGAGNDTNLRSKKDRVSYPKQTKEQVIAGCTSELKKKSPNPPKVEIDACVDFIFKNMEK